LSEQSIASLKKFLTQYWYTVIFIVVGILILMVSQLFFLKRLPPDTLAGFDLTTYSSNLLGGRRRRYH
jgi:MFS superfamily sulfate permease-like transporter